MTSGALGAQSPSGEAPAREVDALIASGDEARRTGRTVEARRCYEAALHAIDPIDAGPVALKLLRWIAWTHVTEGSPDAALDCVEASEAVAVAIDDPRGLASALNSRAGILFGLGRLDEADELFRRVRELAVQVGDRKLQAMADQNLGNVASIHGDAELALTRYQSSLAIFEALGERAYLGPLLNNIGRLRYDLKEYAAAEKALRRARSSCLRESDGHHLTIVEVNRAKVMLRAGDSLAALRTSETARRIAEGAADDRWMADILLVSGASHAKLGDPERAVALLDRAASLARRREDPKVLADVLLEQASALRLVGRNQDTLRRLTEARTLFDALRARRDLADVGEQLDELERVFLQIVTEWGQSIESKDAYTQGHCTRVADYACLLADAYGIGRDAMTWFRMGALLHDVGKVSVPLEILNKKGRLDDDEWAVMASHPVAGIELLDGIEFPWDVRPMIRHHHERWQGGGYPDKIAGEEIPIEARILTIADIYDALTTTRSYRAGFSHEKAMDILRSESGVAVDPELFRLFEAEIAPIIGERVGRDPKVVPISRVA